MSYGLRYKMDWKDTEGQLIMVKIYDALGGEPGPRPFNLQYTAVNNGNGTMTVTFTFDPLPAGTLSVTIYYLVDGTAINGSQTTGFVSPIVITIPWNDWHFIFSIHSATPPDHIINLNEYYANVEELTPSGIGFELSVIDNDEDVSKVVRAKQAVMRFLSTSNFALKTFAGPRSFDFRYYVTAERSIPDRFIFKGFLVLDDLSEPFLAPRNEVVLTATDRLGTLKNSNLVDFENENPRGYNSIAKYLAYALRKTGMSLRINVVMNIKEQSSAPFRGPSLIDAPARFIVPLTPLWVVGKEIKISNTALNNVTGTITLVDGPIASGPYIGQYYVFFNDAVTPLVLENAADALFEDAKGHMYHRVNIEAKTFEAIINESIKSYSVLEYLLGEGMFITQEKGEWWIMRQNEAESTSPIRVAIFDENGEFVQYNAPEYFNKTISRLSNISFTQNRTTVVLTRPVKYIKETFNYRTPAEIICNIDFSRGELTADISPTEKHYAIECWRLRKSFFPTSDDIDPTTSAYTKRIFVNDVETERYVVIVAHAAPSNVLVSEKMPVSAKDKFTVSLGRRLSADVGGSGFYRDEALQVRLYGDDGTFWTCHGKTSIANDKPLWVQSNAAFTINNKFFSIEGDQSEDQTQENNLYDGESAEIPVSGFIQIRVFQSGLYGDTRDTYIMSVGFEYRPFINGSYKKFLGQSNKVTQIQDTEEYNAVRDQEVFISDSPRKLFKGSMFVHNGFNLLFTGLATFSAPNIITIPGNYIGLFSKNQKIKVAGSTLNDGYPTVASVVYHIIGNVTDIVINGSIATEGSVSITLSEARYILAGLFYDSNVFPGANISADSFFPYGKLQAFDVFNQYNRVFSKFRATLQGLSEAELDSLGRADVPGLTQRYFIQDSSFHAMNKNFQALSFIQDFENCGWTGLLREVFDNTISKILDGHEFKYIEK